ncbi:MAG: ParB N-terminal domain-containing protein [Planctomycetes bacterium]|nr:ParB N-terminal domain-containing protein [Planctomycetota bacterium]
MGLTKKKEDVKNAAARPRGRKKARARPAGPIGLGPEEVLGPPPETIRELQAQVAQEGAAVLATYRDPVGGRWLLLLAVPVDRIDPTPFQREASKAHVEKIARVIEKVGRFLDPVILCRAGGGRFWTPNGNHRLEALKAMAAKTVIGLMVPEAEIAHQILALNTEKGYNLREKALGVMRLLRNLSETAGKDPQGTEWPERTEASLSFEFEEAALLTLGIAYEKRPRFSGGAYQSILRRVDAFLEEPLKKALEARERRAGRLLGVDDLVIGLVDRLKQRGLQSPYLKAFVVARVNPIRFHKGEPPPFDATLEKMEAALRKFDPSKVREEDLARAGGPPEEA